jgi:tetratricopeptide (TPR) repeat protein
MAAGGSKRSGEARDGALESAPTLASADGLAATLPPDPDTAPLAVGAVLAGRYRLLQELGRGAFGAVYRAHDQVADEQVAIKILGRELGRAPATSQRVRRELRAARLVSHPGVVRLHDLIDLGDQLALSMELVEGETLQARLARAPRLPLPALEALARELAAALAAAHQAGVVHRDLKPANIMLRVGSGRAVITDFGISRLTPAEGAAAVEEARLTKEGELVGTPLYMAPEQLLARGEAGPAADVYALGVVLYEAATGQVPHGGHGLVSLVAARLHDPVPPLRSLAAEVPPDLAAIVDRCLAHDPRARFASGVELLEALAPGAASTSRLRAPGAASSRRRRRLGAALAAVAVVAVLGAAAGIWSGRLPGGERRLLVAVAHRGEPRDAWLAAAAQRLAARDLRARDVRFAVVDDAARANVVLRLELRRVAEGAWVRASVGRAGGRAQPVGEVVAPSVREALRRVLPAVAARVGAGRPERGPDAAERAEMTALGTDSVTAYRLYRRALCDYVSTVAIDADTVEPLLAQAQRHDPGWAHPHVLLVASQGRVSPRAQATLQAARAELGAGPRDPAGRAMLQALDVAGRGQLAESTRLLEEATRHAPRDVLAGFLLSIAYYNEHRADEVVAVTQRIHELRPDLQFGANLAGALENVGRGDEVAPMLEAWLRAAPDNEQARASLVAVEVRRQRLAVAEERVRELIFLHGEGPVHLAMLCDVLISAERTREARAVAARLLQAAPQHRARGRYRLGVIATLEGRLAAAYDSLVGAVREARPFGEEADIKQTLEAAQALAVAAGRGADRDALLEELARLQELGGAPGLGAATRFERALHARGAGPCPDLEAAAARLPDGPVRQAARRAMMRAAADAGCAPCAAVVRDGLSAQEHSQVALFRFGRCAEREGHAQLAADAFERVRPLPGTSIDPQTMPSPYHAVLARFHLARAQARLGHRDAARAAYDGFLERWGHADRLVPEVEEARRVVATLR